jgi:glycine/D-amino acid oxidase-like deaminating enzyme
MRVADQLGVRIFENSPVRTLSARSHAIELSAAAGSLTAAQVLLATNVFPSLLRRYRMHTVPVYDYVLMTEPLSDAQLNSIGWRNRQGLADTANQFHYYRLTKQNRIMFGGYDALYFFGGKMQEHREDRAETHRKLASHFLTTFPQLKNVRFTHRWAGVIDTSTRFCSFFGQAHGGRVQYAAGFTGLGVAATRFAANVMLDRAEGKETHRTSPKLVREVPIPFPPEPFAFASIQAARWALDRADHNEGKRNLLLRTLDALGFGFNS